MTLQTLKLRTTSLWASLEARFGRSTCLLGLALIFAGLFAFIWDQRTKEQPVAQTVNEDSSRVDTFIPAGFVLVPIQVSNYEALDSVLGNFGVVDLYLPPTETSQKPKRVAERIKILRAPLNPNHFAVLAPESQSPALVSHEGAFFVVVQNPTRTGTRFVKDQPRRQRSRIVVEAPE